MPKLSIRRRASAMGPNAGVRGTGGGTCVGTLVGRSKPKGSDASVITAVLGWSGMVRPTLGLQSIDWVCRCHLAGPYRRLASAVAARGRIFGPLEWAKFGLTRRRLHEPVARGVAAHGAVDLPSHAGACGER